MAWIGEAVTNATMRLGHKYELTEQLATVAMGIGTGVAVSVVLMACLSVCSRTRLSLQRRAIRNERPPSPREQSHRSLNTEGAYRSDSDTEDEGLAKNRG